MKFDSENYQFSDRFCQANTSEREAYESFANSKDPWSAVELMNRHERCYDEETISRGCSGCATQSDHVHEPQFGLSLALPTSCRQIYHEAQPLSHLANTVSFTTPVHNWHWSIADRPLADFLHSMHLDIMVNTVIEERSWNYSFQYIAEHFKSLSDFHIDIEQCPQYPDILERWHFQNPADCSFINDLRVLRDLQLRIVTVTVADGQIPYWEKENLWTEDETKYRWSMAQKQEWAAYMTRVLLREEE